MTSNTIHYLPGDYKLSHERAKVNFLTVKSLLLGNKLL